MTSSTPVPPRPPSDDALRSRWEADIVDHPAQREGCPSPEALLDAVEAGLLEPDASASPELVTTVLHISRCAACREDARIAGALLGAALPGEGLGGPALDAVAPSAVAAALPRRWRPSLPLAAAASVLVVAGGLGLALWSGMGGDGAYRGGDGSRFVPAVTCTQPGVALVRWAVRDGASSYRVELFSSSGTVLAEAVLPASAEADSPAAGAAGLSLELSFDYGASGQGDDPVRAMVEARLPGGRLEASVATLLPASCLGAPPAEG